MKKIYAMMLILMLALTACQIPSSNTGTGNNIVFEGSLLNDEIKTKHFESEEELKAFLDQFGRDGGFGYAARGGVMMETAVMDDSAAMDFEESATPQAANKVGGDLDYSGTNVQVEGVDEADILKTDGEYIYTITDKTLFVIRAYPGEDAEVLSRITLEDRPQGLFVDGDNLAVFGYVETLDYDKIEYLPRGGMTFLEIYDVSDRRNPDKVKDFKFEGNYFEGRMKGDTMYLVLNSQPNYVGIPMPLIIEGTSVSNVAVSDITYYDIPYDNVQFTTVHGIDLSSGSIIDSETIASEYTQNIYMSDENLYITYTKYINEWEIEQQITIDMIEPRLSVTDKALIESIKNTDSRVLSMNEKRSKILQVVNNYMRYLPRDEQEDLRDDILKELKKKLEEFEHMEYTIINKVSVKDGQIEPRANGKIPGHLNNQFSMDEHDDVLRVASTVNPRWNRFVEMEIEEFEEARSKEVETMVSSRIAAPQQRTESTNNIYTLDEDLRLLDKEEGLAEGERIFSTRFMGDKLYMVTFRQVDPFFVVDLSNPRNIRVLGELKIPGFSRYLHPFDENTIIGLGRDATQEGRQQGLKISLFDVSDVRNPKEIVNFVTKERYAQSNAEWEHKAFLFSKEKELLVIPASSYDYERSGDSYNGALVFKITTDDIELRGLIDHSSGFSGRWYGPGVERSLYIEELLYTKSPNLLRINELSDLSSVKNVELRTDYKGEIPIY